MCLQMNSSWKSCACAEYVRTVEVESTVIKASTSCSHTLTNLFIHSLAKQLKFSSNVCTLAF